MKTVPFDISLVKFEERVDSKDYDWFNIDLSLSDIEALLSLAERSKVQSRR